MAGGETQTQIAVVWVGCVEVVQLLVVTDNVTGRRRLAELAKPLTRQMENNSRIGLTTSTGAGSLPATNNSTLVHKGNISYSMRRKIPY